MLRAVISGKELTPKNKRLREDLEHRLNRWSQETANHIGEALEQKYASANKMAKAEVPETNPDDDTQYEVLAGGKRIPKWQSNAIRAVALLAWRSIGWSALVDLFKPYLKDAGDEGVDVGIGQVQMADASKVREKAEETAEQYADRRSAEVAGMQREEDGSLAEDPDAHWPLTDVMRRDIDASAILAVTEGWTAEQLAAVIEASYALSPERNAIIADNELTSAQSGGTYAVWEESETTTLVRWVTSDRHVNVDECDGYEAQGIVPLGHEFAEGLFSPRAHPACLCELEAVDPSEVFDSLPSGQ